MKSKLKYLMLTAGISMNHIFLTYADNSNRMDIQLLEGILTFLQNCSYFLFVTGIGMFIYSIKNEDGSKKLDSLKLVGIGLLLYVLKYIAKIGHLI